MNSSAIEAGPAQAKDVVITDESVVLDLTDGRSLCVPVSWYPRLAHGSAVERANWNLIGDGEGIHWPDLDEDVRVEDLLQGRPSNESESSIRRWLETRSRKS